MTDQPLVTLNAAEAAIARKNGHPVYVWTPTAPVFYSIPGWNTPTVPPVVVPPVVIPPVVTPPVVVPPATGTLLRGVYMGPADPSGIAKFASATSTKVDIVVDYIQNNDGWVGVSGANGSLDWLLNAWKGTGYTLCLGVPIIPVDSSGAPQGTLASGASGAYDSYYTALAQVLVAAGQENCYLRLGWEFDGNWYKWDAQNPTDEANYLAYFQHIVTAMRSVSGANFKFIWNPDASAFTESGYNVEQAFPGDKYVDVIGLDLYDFNWSSPTEAGAWANFLAQMNDTDAFATAQGKPIAFCEWAIAPVTSHGFGDDPAFITNMVAWMKSHNVIFEAYFNGDTTQGVDSYLANGNFPNSLAAFTKALG